MQTIISDKKKVPKITNPEIKTDQQYVSSDLETESLSYQMNR